MARVPHSTVDPALDAASVLRRIGFLVLAVGLPFGALGSRNGAVVVYTIGLALVIGASVFDGANRPLRESLALVARAPALFAVATLGGWALLSLAWTPTPRAAALPSTGLVFVLALVGFASLPDRMRAANLYLAPIGAAVAAAACLALIVATNASTDPEAPRRIERGLVVAVLVAWPGIAWLRSRGRDVESVGLATLTAVAAGFGPGPAPILAFTAGAVAFLIAQVWETRGASAIGIALAVLVVSAPALLIWGVPLVRVAGWTATLEPWREAILRNPVRLLTGRGVGAVRVASEGLRDLRHVGTPLLALWYELGLVGALAVAATLAGTLRGTSVDFGPLRPALAGVVATAFGLGVSGIDGGETWWFATLFVVALTFLAAERGQFRTRRPRAVVAGQSRPVIGKRPT